MWLLSISTEMSKAPQTQTYLPEPVFHSGYHVFAQPPVLLGMAMVPWESLSEAFRTAPLRSRWGVGGAVLSPFSLLSFLPGLGKDEKGRERSRLTAFSLYFLCEHFRWVEFSLLTSNTILQQIRPSTCSTPAFFPVEYVRKFSGRRAN